GRYQQIDEQKCQWFLDEAHDGAHNESSLRYAVEWFAETVVENQRRILIFSQFSTRDSTVLLHSIAESLQDHHVHIQYVILTTYAERRDGQTWSDRNMRTHFPVEV
ncbi:hypothetical protein DL95DRAFT_499201, partial [Leptodontidium sp. 2 PMI_412]